MAEVLQAVLAHPVVERLESVEGLLRGEDEHLVGGGRRLRLVGLVGVVGDRAVLGDLHDAVARGVVRLDLGGHHRDLRTRAQVGVDDVAVVELVDGVGADHDQRIGVELPDQLGLPPEPVGGALGPAAALAALERRQHHQPAGGAVQVPGAAVGEVLVDRLRLVLHRHPHIGDAGVLAVGQREVDQPVDAGERDRGLGPGLGEELQPAALATGEHEHEDLRERHGCPATRAHRVQAPTVSPRPSSGAQPRRPRRRERRGTARTTALRRRPPPSRPRSRPRRRPSPG